MEDMWDIKRVLGSQGDAHTKVENQSKLELQSLTLSQSWGLGPHCLQIDTQDAYDLQFGHSSYAWKDKEIRFLTQPSLMVN
jgi:hypothetical protein